MSEPASKAKRRWIIIPWAVAIILCLGWSLYWVVGSRELGKALDHGAETLGEAGYSVSWDQRRIGGYPFRYFVQIDGLTIQKPGGWGLAAPRLEAEASALTPGVAVLVAPQGIDLSRPNRPALAITGEVLRMSLGGLFERPVRVSMEGIGLSLAAAEGPPPTFSAIERFSAHLRPVDGDRAQVFFRIDQATPAPDTLLERLAGERKITLGVEGQVSHASALKGRDPQSLLSAWSAAGGALDIAQGGIAADTDLLALRPSTLSIQPDGYLSGELAMSLTQVADGMLVLGQIGVLPEQTAAVGSGVAGAEAALTGAGGLSATLRFEEAMTRIGPIPLGPAPRLFESTP